MPWDPTAGGGQVNQMLSRYFARAGHDVNRYTLDEAFGTEGRFTQYFGNALFPLKATQYVRNHGDKVDFIQASQGALPVPKRYLQTSALVVYHSQGLYHLHRKVDNRVPTRDERQGSLLSHVAGAISGAVTNLPWVIDRSIRTSDVVAVMNSDEYRYIETHFPEKRIVLKPNGLSERRLDALRQVYTDGNERRKSPTIGYIGIWNPRKGALDLPEIFRLVKRKQPDVSFRLMGTGRSTPSVLDDFSPAIQESIEVIPSYSYEELPRLLEDITVGLLPSYMEGFGLGVLEMMAAGIPTVTYDVPGPRDTIGCVSESMMVSPGDRGRMAEKITGILARKESTYRRLGQNCIEVAQRFRWEEIVPRYLQDLGFSAEEKPS
jgi:glycosyltransferase involved in cell wall biosynthesis